MSFPGTGRRRRKSAATDVNPRARPRRVRVREPSREDVWMRRDGGIDERFAEYVRARGEHVLRVAVLLTGDWHAAEDLVQASLVKLYRAWPRLDTAEDPGRLPAADHGEHAAVLVAGAVA